MILYSERYFQLLWQKPSCEQRKNCEGSSLNYLTYEELRHGAHLLSWKPDSERSKFHRKIKINSGALLYLLFEWNPRPFKRYIALVLRQPDNPCSYELVNVTVRLNCQQSIKITQSSKNKEKWGPLQLKNCSCPSLVEIFLGFNTSISAEKTTVNCLENLPNDVQIVVKGQIFYASAYWLAAVSPVFTAMFRSDFIESINGVVKIDDMEPEVFEQMLGFIYAVEPNFENEMAEELLIAADKYDIRSLKQECAQVLFNTLSNENAIRVLYLADYYGVPYLFNHVKTFIIDNWGPEELYFHPDRKLLIYNYRDIVKTINRVK